MENKNVMSVEDLLTMNEMMLGRGVPVQEDGIGYNKADYGACATYYYGLSNAQIADLSKRLVKYSNTQLHISKDLMKETANYYATLVNGSTDRRDGISLKITEDGTLISFSYNELYIETIKALPRASRQYNGEHKCWVVMNDRVITLLNELSVLGADVENALEYAKNHELMQNVTTPKIEKVDILTKLEGDFALLKFDYNKDIVEAVKSIDYKDRKWNAEYKFWSIKQNHLGKLKEVLSHIANFKVM